VVSVDAREFQGGAAFPVYREEIGASLQQHRENRPVNGKSDGLEKRRLAFGSMLIWVGSGGKQQPYGLRAHGASELERQTVAAPQIRTGSSGKQRPQSANAFPGVLGAMAKRECHQSHACIPALVQVHGLGDYGNRCVVAFDHCIGDLPHRAGLKVPHAPLRILVSSPKLIGTLLKKPDAIGLDLGGAVEDADGAVFIDLCGNRCRNDSQG